MFDFGDTRHLHVEFMLDQVRNEARSRSEGRPIYEDREMVVIRFVGDRKKELVAPAAEKFTRDRATGAWVSYAEAFPRHYEAFRSGCKSALVEGTPLREAGFLTPSQVKEFEALNLHTVEQLAALEGAALQRLGLHGRDHKARAMQYLEHAAGNAMEYRLKQENGELRRRLEALERIVSAARGEGAGLAALSDADLRTYIKAQTGQAPRGAATRETLLRKAQDAAAPPAPPDA
ncbi:MAG: hypothetical protein AB7R87_08755 [Parvibaculaceae bacterium]